MEKHKRAAAIPALIVASGVGVTGERTSHKNAAAAISVKHKANLAAFLYICRTSVPWELAAVNRMSSLLNEFNNSIHSYKLAVQCIRLGPSMRRIRNGRNSPSRVSKNLSPGCSVRIGLLASLRLNEVSMMNSHPFLQWGILDEGRAGDSCTRSISEGEPSIHEAGLF